MSQLAEHEKANEQKWDRRSESFDNKRFNYFRWMQKQVLSLIRFQKSTSFLDLGCGTGWAVCHVSNLLNGQGQFIGIDISKGMTQRAKENSAGLKNVSFYNASAEQLPIEGDTIDNIICTNSFHHYLHPEKALAEIRRVLKDKGRIYILDVTSDDFFINWIDSLIAKREKGHVRFHNTREIGNMFLTTGLKHIQSKWIWYPLKVHVAEK
ncbi:MAG TPA: methyltransferase domain-containing protein [Nitrospirota bacterium]|nr:methyltransferase domain-containing protein [Nitrospirota bacterium]